MQLDLNARRKGIPQDPRGPWAGPQLERGAGRAFYRSLNATGGTSPWRRARALVIAIPLAVGALGACFTTPITGRSAINFMSVEDDKQLGADAYADMLKESQVVSSGPDADMVERVMKRLVAVADDPGFAWEVKLLKDDETVNAFCLPGGKMAVYTGILPVTKSEAGLAVVMGHEIAHAVARHGTERVSIELGTQFVIELAAGEHQTEAGWAKDLFVSLPYGRRQESEADHIGLFYMARAGYDPATAVDFWTRMSSLSQGSPPEILSTHPSDETRIANLKKLMPAAQREWKAPGVSP